MKKALKLIGKILLGFIILDIIIILIMFVYNRIMLSKEDKLLENYPGQLVEVDGHNMNVFVEGEGTHTLVFLSPSQDTSPAISFKPLYSKLSDDYRVAVVEKFGYGMSDVVDTERDYETMVDECRNALEKAGVEAPYILCPYSKSGVDTLIWAQKYPDEVEAVVSIDMAFPEHFDKMGIDTKQLKTSSTFMDVARATGIIRLFVPDSAFSPLHSDDDIKLERALVCRKFGNHIINYDEIVTLPDACELIKSNPFPDKPMLLFLTNGVTEMDTETWQEIAHSYADDLEVKTFTAFDCTHYEIIEKESEQMSQDIKDFINKISE